MKVCVVCGGGGKLYEIDAQGHVLVPLKGETCASCKGKGFR